METKNSGVSDGDEVVAIVPITLGLFGLVGGVSLTTFCIYAITIVGSEPNVGQSQSPGYVPWVLTGGILFGAIVARSSYPLIAGTYKRNGGYAVSPPFMYLLGATLPIVYISAYLMGTPTQAYDWVRGTVFSIVLIWVGRVRQVKAKRLSENREENPASPGREQFARVSTIAVILAATLILFGKLNT